MASKKQSLRMVCGLSGVFAVGVLFVAVDDLKQNTQDTLASVERLSIAVAEVRKNLNRATEPVQSNGPVPFRFSFEKSSLRAGWAKRRLREVVGGIQKNGLPDYGPAERFEDPMKFRA